jgi:hypothetical protein
MNKRIACGLYHSLALKSDGTLVSWGYDNHLQVTNTPTGNDFIGIAGGFWHSLALKSDGTLVSWGRNDNLQVSSTPTGNDFIEIACGGYHSLALKSDGTLVSWGNDNVLQVSNTPTGNNFIGIACGQYHSLALKSDGTLVSWGRDNYLQVSNTPTGNDFLLISFLNKYLFKNETTGVFYAPTGVSSFINLGIGPLTETDFLDRGVEDFAVFENTVINAINNGYFGDSPGIYHYTDDDGVTNRDLIVDYLPHPQLVLSTGDLSLVSVENIDNINLASNEVGSGILRIIVSIDSGATWQAFDNVNWVNIDTGDLNDIKTNGMTSSILNSLTSEQIMNLVGVSTNLRFGYYLEATDISDTLETDELSIQIDMRGQWDKATHGVDFDYNYPNSITLTVELYADGDYKINY